jgi:hypothetical protein
MIQDGEEYQFGSEQIGPLLDFLQDTKTQTKRYTKIKLDFSYFVDDYKQLILIGNAMKNHRLIRSMDIDMECYENEGQNPESEPTALYSYFETLKNLRIIRLNFDGASFTD